MKISVALCTYNGEKYLRKQLDSILEQSIPVNEIVVCDDRSTDATLSILNEYALKYPDLFQIVVNEQNLRSNKNFEKAFQLTTGDYIFFADQDDIWRKDKVEVILSKFKECPEVLGVFSNADLIDDEGAIMFDDKISLWDSVYFFESAYSQEIDLFSLLLLKGNFLTGATLCVKKESKECCLPFVTMEKKFLHDEWFAYRLAKEKKLAYVSEKLISYRLHSQQQMGVGEIQKNIEGYQKNKKYFDIVLGILKPTRFKHFKVLTRHLFTQYEKYKAMAKENVIFKDSEKYLLKQYLLFDNGMKKSNPLMYYFRKRKDLKKGRRQINID